MTCEIVPASPKHIRPMSRRLRAGACVTLQAYGFDPRRALHDVFLKSHYSRTALIEGKPVAMWGLLGQLLSETAFVWLVTSDEIGRFPGLLVRETRRELAEMMQGYREFSTTVLPNDEAAVRFALYLGFHDDGEEENEEDEPVSHKRRAQQIMLNPRRRIPIGENYVIGLTYQGREA